MIESLREGEEKNLNHRKKILTIYLIVFGLIIFCMGVFFYARKPKKLIFSQTRLTMGTFMKMDTCLETDDESKIAEVYRKAWERIDAISSNMSAFKREGDVSKINNSGITSVQVKEDTYFLLEESSRYTAMTQGAFDITVLPLIKLWKSAREMGRIPDKEKINEVKEFVGMPNVELLKDNSVRIRKDGAKIDLGGIAKGYAIDETVRILKENGFDDFFIDAGGDIYVGGQSCRKRPWRVGVRDPLNRERIIDVVELRDAAITTSGNYEQFYEIEGKNFSHIMDPRTGYPQEGIISATVIAPSAKEADALSTALCVLGVSEGLALIDSLKKKFGGLIIESSESKEITVHQSRNYKKFLFR